MSLPLAEWRLAAGMKILELECIKSGWMGADRGMRDYDVGVWLRIGAEDAEDSTNEIWDAAEIKEWHVEMLHQSEYCKSFPETIRQLILSWSANRLHMPVIVRSWMAESIFSHIAPLRKLMNDSCADENG